MTGKGRTAIVTGASRGIGRAVAKRLGGDGAAVVVNYLRDREAAESVVKTIGKAGGRAVAVQGDVSAAADVERLFDVGTAEFGGVDVVVNNAAEFVGGPLEHIGEDSFDRMVAVNLKGVYLTCRQASRRLRDGGRIINVSAGLPPDGIAFLGLYGATKAAVELLTRSLAHQLGPRGITVNAVAPGPTDTDMLAPEARAHLDRIIGQTPLGRLGQPEDVAGVVALLAGPDARWVSGQVIHVGGGILSA